MITTSRSAESSRFGELREDLLRDPAERVGQRLGGHRQPQRTGGEPRFGQLPELLAHPLGGGPRSAQRTPSGRLYGGLEARRYEDQAPPPRPGPWPVPPPPLPPPPPPG